MGANFKSLFTPHFALHQTCTVCLGTNTSIQMYMATDTPDKAIGETSIRCTHV